MQQRDKEEMKKLEEQEKNEKDRYIHAFKFLHIHLLKS